MEFSKPTILDAIAALMHHRFNVTGEWDKRFILECADLAALAENGKAVTSHRTPKTITVDLYLPAPLNCIVQFDDARHCTRQRALTFADYPADAPLNFDVRRYRADQDAGDAELARQDVLIDLLPAKHGLNPTVRVRHDEVAELPGTLQERVEQLLSKRFAYHAGTTFHLMLENAGAKPHRTL